MCSSQLCLWNTLKSDTLHFQGFVNSGYSVNGMPPVSIGSLFCCCFFFFVVVVEVVCVSASHAGVLAFV